ncbi:hypothetical protein D3C78_1035520 [compost metagenome]
MRRAFYAVKARLFEPGLELVIDPAFEPFDTFRNHAIDGRGIVALVSGHKAYAVAGRDFEKIGLEYHRALFAPVQHFHLEGLG